MSKEQILSALGSKGGVAVIVGTLSGVSGVAAGYFFAKRRLEARYISISNREIMEARHLYQKKLYEQRVAVVEAANALDAYSGVEEVPTIEPEDPEVSAEDEVHQNHRAPREGSNNRVRYDLMAGAEKPSLEVLAEQSTALNVFTDPGNQPSDEDDDWAEEVANRDERVPYVISHEEYLANEPGHDQMDLTYYDEDDVLVDDRDIPVADVLMVAGPDNLKFGLRSGGKDTVYVRNHRLGSDYEITRITGSFSSAIGFQHSDEPRRKQRPRRMRPDDD